MIAPRRAQTQSMSVTGQHVLTVLGIIIIAGLFFSNVTVMTGGPATPAQAQHPSPSELSTWADLNTVSDSSDRLIVDNSDEDQIGDSNVNNTTSAEQTKNIRMPSDINYVIKNSSAVQSTTPDKELYTVIANDTESINTDQLSEYGEVGTQGGRLVELRMFPNERGTVLKIPWVEHIREAISTHFPRIAGSGNIGSLGVQELHKQGVTGEDVRIGIIDSGFNISASDITQNVVDRQQFNESSTSSDHGTHTAQVITQTAPDTSLYLTTIDSLSDSVAAVGYLRNQSVDIIIHNIMYYGLDDDGQHALSNPMGNAREDGILVINAAGNQRQGHWQGQFADTNNNGFHEWNNTSNSEVQCISGIYEASDRRCQEPASNGTLTAYLDWPDENDSSEYQIELRDVKSNDTINISKPVNFDPDQNQQYLSFELEQPRDVGIAVKHIGGPANDELELRVINRGINDYIENSSVGPPADVPEVVSVAAYARSKDRTAVYSGVGPTDDERLVPTVTGYTNIELPNYTFGGTSAAAPYVAGVAALIEDAAPGNQSPAELEQQLRSTADDIYRPGEDIRSGAGVVNATAAVTETQQINDAVFNISIIQTNSPVEEGEVMEVTAAIENTGNTSGTQTINLDMGSLGSDSRSVSVNSGISKERVLAVSTNTGDAGSYTAAVSSDNDSASQPVTVQEADDSDSLQLGSRVPKTVNASPNESVKITIEYSSSKSNIELYNETIVAGQELAQIIDTTSDRTQGTVSDGGNSASAAYTSPVDSDTLSVTVQVSEDASDGETVTLSGTIVNDTGETSTGKTTITVEEGPAVADYANEDGRVEITGLRRAIDDFTSRAIDIDLLRDVIDAFTSRNSVT